MQVLFKGLSDGINYLTDYLSIGPNALSEIGKLR